VSPMPTWAIIYINVFAGIVIFNTVFWLQIRQVPALILYQFGSGMYMVMLMIAHWQPWLVETLSIFNVPAILAIFMIDIYISVWVKTKIDIERVLPGLDPELLDLVRQFSVLDIARTFSLAITSPAYVISAIVAFRLIRIHGT
jgi:hypothetical protein